MNLMKRNRWTYLKYAIFHPWHVVLLAGATVFGVANWSIPILLSIFFTAEFILLIALLRLKIFRNYVDENLLQKERAQAADLRTNLLLQMMDEHRREFLRLESCVDTLRVRLATFPAISSMAADECMELLAQYVRLAIQYNLMVGTGSHVCIQDLEKSIALLEANQRTQPDPTNEQRIAIARRRIEVLRSSAHVRLDLRNQLYAISEMVELKTEQSILPATPNNPPAIQLRVETENLAEELGEFAHVEEVDVDVLRLGRTT